MHAATITVNLPEFNGPWLPDGPYPANPVDAGTFNFAIPNGPFIVSATYNSTFGNSQVTNSSGVNVYGDGILLGQCLAGAVCDTDTSATTPFLYQFSSADLQALSDGALAITAVQTSAKEIRLGAQTLTIHTAASSTISGVPEPGSLLLLAIGLMVIAWRYSRRAALCADRCAPPDRQSDRT